MEVREVNELVLDDDFLWQFWLPIKVVWLRIRQLENQALWMSMKNEELIGVCIDCERLREYGYEKQARLMHRAIDLYGRNEVIKFLGTKVFLA